MTGGAIAARPATVENDPTILFDGIKAFLTEHRLSPDPRHYTFAYRLLTDLGGPLAAAVSTLTEGGFRLSSRDIESLGGEIGQLAVPEMPGAGPAAAIEPAEEASEPTATPAANADGLVARTQMQVEGFTDMMHAMRAETRGFGLDLAASADAMRQSSDVLGVEEVVRLTGAMLDRVRTAETRLEAATHEASELRAKLEEARDNARRDPLTDLPNRRAFEEAFAAQSASGESLCVAVCDVDLFKRVNDRFGHAVGDRVLKAIGETLRRSCDGHMVARYGGEEFVVLFSGVDRDSAMATLDAARETVASKRFRIRESEQALGAVTFSAGLTQAIPDEDLGAAFARADTLLYAAKDAGRNMLKTG